MTPYWIVTAAYLSGSKSWVPVVQAYATYEAAQDRVRLTRLNTLLKDPEISGPFYKAMPIVP